MDGPGCGPVLFQRAQDTLVGERSALSGPTPFSHISGSGGPKR